MSAKKNMLEAFRNAAGEPEPKPETTRVHSAPPPAHPLPLGASVRVPPTVLPGWIGWALLVVLAFVGGVLVGRGPVVAGAEGEEQPGEASDGAPDAGVAGIVPAREPQASAPTREEASEQPRTDGRAIKDPENKYTVVVASYGLSMVDLAWATVDFLRAQRIAAHPPFRLSNAIVVVAGAAPRKSDLEELVRQVRGLARDGTPGVYDDAYIDAIDRLELR